MNAAVVICNCGLVKQVKVGTTDHDGIDVCNACGLPIKLTIAATASAVSIKVRLDHVTTLQTLPGYTITRVLGVVTELSATSGLTATQKGTAALEAGMASLCVAAGAMGANAILGLTSSTFGAAGGITSTFGGDAVGVLLVGTAAVVEPVGDPANGLSPE
jgi:uncharacterized protein YbjQ (UPF0145 family)